MELDDKGAGVEDENRYPEPGDWVLVWGQISRGPTHPEDVLVEFTSHNSNYTGDVKINRVVVPDDIPEFAQECTALYEFKPDRLIRCVRHDQHGGLHHDRKGRTWDDALTYGHVEVS